MALEEIEMTYEYNPNVIKMCIQDNTHLFTNYDNSNKETYMEDLKEPAAKHIHEQLKEQLYLIAPNPMKKNVVFIVYETEQRAYFYEYNNSRKVQRNLQNQYKKIFHKFKYFFPFKRFITNLDFYKEIELMSRNILLGDGTIYNFDDMKFSTKSYDLPTSIMSRYNFQELKEQDMEILDKCFKIMYNNEKDWNQFLYYILCNLDKGFTEPQSMFLIIDKSGVGKTSKILPMVAIGLNQIVNARLLENSEVYNIAYTNNVIVNESQNENFNGSSLNNIVDNTPYTVTRKGDDSLTINSEDKPLVQVMGETLPFIKSFSDGNNRRMFLVPKVSMEFIEFKEKVENEHIIKPFFSILNNKPIQVIQYYIDQIIQNNIINKKVQIKEEMGVTLKDLSKLIENKEDIFAKYFNLNPIDKYESNDDITLVRYLIESKSMDYFLEYIDMNLITVSHFNITSLRRKYLRKLIKDNGKNVSQYQKTTHEKGNYSYAFCLTAAGVKLVEKINDKHIYEDKLIYIKR